MMEVDTRGYKLYGSIYMNLGKGKMIGTVVARDRRCQGLWLPGTEPMMEGGGNLQRSIRKLFG